MMRRTTCILLFLILAACGNREGGSPFSSDNYTGFWMGRQNQCETLTISREGEGYLIDDGSGTKLVGAVHDGVLSVSGPTGRNDALYSSSSKSLIFAGREFERRDAGTICDPKAAAITMAGMRSIAIAWEARATDVNRYNAGGQQFIEPAYEVTTPQLDTMVSPTYIKDFPRAAKDGWGNPYEFRIDVPVGGEQRAQTYSIRSTGKDRIKEKSPVGGKTANFDCDIIYSNGAFLQYPEHH